MSVSTRCSEPDPDAETSNKIDDTLDIIVKEKGIVCTVLLNDTEVGHAIRSIVDFLSDHLVSAAPDLVTLSKALDDNGLEPVTPEKVASYEAGVDVVKRDFDGELEL